MGRQPMAVRGPNSWSVPASVSCNVQISFSLSRVLVTNLAVFHVALRRYLWPDLVRQCSCTIHGPFIEDCVRSRCNVSHSTAWPATCALCCTDSDTFYLEYIYVFVWWGVCKQSRWRHSVTVPHTRWRICVTMATLWQQQDGGYMLLWKRYGNNKML